MGSYPADGRRAAAAVVDADGAAGLTAVDVGTGGGLAPEIEAAMHFITGGAAVRDAESVTGPLA